MTKTLHVFTEEPSAQNVFEIILPKLLPANVFFRVYSHQGKQDLEKALKTTLPSISKIPGARILITRDQDNADCVDVKANLKNIIGQNCKCTYFVRIVCTELESWFLGDLNAVKMAYPRLKPEHYISKADFRNVDTITKPNKTLLKILPEYNDREHLPKLEVSESIAPHLNFENNSSISFNQTISAIRKLVEA